MIDPQDNLTAAALSNGTRAQQSLPVALRAAAGEVRGQAARDLRRLADRLEAGMELDAALDHPAGPAPGQFAALIRAGVRAGDLGAVLAEMSHVAGALRNMRTEWMLALAYPGVVFLGTLLLVAVAFEKVVPTLLATLQSLDGHAVPQLIQTTYSIGQNFVEMIVSLLATVMLGLGLARIILGRIRFSWFVTTIPLIGAPMLWGATWEWLVMLRQLVARDVPLPESLRLAAGSIRSPHVAAASRAVAARIEAGESWEQVLGRANYLPAGLAPLLGWGEARQAFDESLQLAAEIMAERMHLRLAWLRMALPAVLFVLIAALVGCVVTTCVAPLVIMIDWLS
jgi:general secretion pathway protein F